MGDEEISELEKKAATPIILIENNGIAFFDVATPVNPLNAEDAKDYPFWRSYYGVEWNCQVYNCEEGYFSVGNYSGVLKTRCVVTPCLVISAFVSRNGKITSSGVYHAESAPNSETFRKKAHMLIDTVRLNPDEDIIVKVTGATSYSSPKYLNKEKKEQDIRTVFAGEGVEISDENLRLGFGSLIEFYPQYGVIVAMSSSSRKVKDRF